MKLIDVRDVSNLTGDSISQIWKKAADEDSGFPEPVKIGGKTLWVEAEVVAYLERKVDEYRSGNKSKRSSVFKAAKTSMQRRAERSQACGDADAESLKNGDCRRCQGSG